MQIDAHHHFWNPARGDYGWIPEENTTLNRTYGPTDIATHLKAAGIDATILVQAAPSIGETEYMLGIADAVSHVAGVTGWIDFENLAHKSELIRLAGHPKFRAIRPMIQDIPDDDWMLRAEVQWGFKMTTDLGLCFEALGFPRHINNFLTIFKRYPDMKVVINHCMKPQIAARDASQFNAWADGIKRLALETSTYCKFSALITEAGKNWQVEELRPYADHVIASFGAERVMWGSDWPVCRLRGEYAEWRTAALELTADLSKAEHASIFGGTANKFYDLGM